MERLTQFRGRAVLAVFGVVLFVFAFLLYDAQIIKTGGVVDNTTTYTTWTTVKAARGEILDRNGNVLVGNRASFDLVINHYVMLSSDGPNDSLMALVKLCRELDIEYTDRFPVTKERPFTYTLDNYNSAWQGYFQTFLANRGDLDSDISAPLLLQKLRESFRIPAHWSEEDARLVIGLRYELSLRNITNLPNYVFIADANDQDLSAILELNTPGMVVEASTVREYYTEYAAHILGYVGPMDSEQWAKYKEKGYSMDAQVGQTGFEKAFEEYLHSTDGIRVDKVTADGTVIESYYRQEPKAGNNVEVTIDINLQMAAEHALEQKMLELKNNERENASGKDCEGAAVVAMDTRTGQVLACASYPTYDLATFSEKYSEILEMEYDPLYNRALQAAYPPGSTYKMSMVISGIQYGWLNSSRTITTLGRFDKYEGFEADCLAYTNGGGNHGTINCMEALCVSCNYFFYELADNISIEVMDETAKGMGLGEKTGIELSEATGHRSNPEVKASIYTERWQDPHWYQGDKILTGIGQSENRFTPMQLCVYASTLANRGKRYQATFLSRVVSADYRSLIKENLPVIASTMDISDDAFYAYSQGMYMVSTDPLGTARTLFRDYPIAVCAKTGTSQHGIRNASDHGAFVCYAPKDNPEIAISVFGEKVGSGGTMGSVAKAIMDIYFEVGEVGEVDTYENQLS